MTQDMRTGKYTRFIVTQLLLLMCGVGKVCAADIVVIIDDGIKHGTVTSSINQSTRVVTLTVTPESGYQTKKDLIMVEKMVNPDNLPAPRRALGMGTFPVTGPDGWQTDEKQYTFTVTNDYDGAYVTVTFLSTTTTTATRITSLSEITDLTVTGNYELASDIDASGYNLGEFKGTLDGKNFTIHHLNHPLFASTDGAIIHDINFESVNISTDGDAGAITPLAKGATRIYNCGILPTTTEYDADGNITGFLGSSVSGSGNVGSLVGKLSGTSRVINCFSYANITGGSVKGGIVGNNSVASTQSSLTTMVMNCMFYGDISVGGTISPIYGGTEINNVSGGLNNYNYYRYESPYSENKYITKYNRALAMEEKFITRFERYRLLLNSNKKLAAIYATGSAANANQMAKWILEAADRQITNPMPYPVLRKREQNKKYPSIINYDAEHAPDSTMVGRLNGGKVSTNDGKLTVTILTKSEKTTGGQSWPTAAASDVQTTSLTLIRTDKDTTRFNFNYDKVQLPYYNDVGTGNYTENRVVTGWKITSITGGNPGDYTEGDSWGGYNFADRNCTNKDKYSDSKRVFSQGAYWDVPKDVTAITIEPYWAIANYVSDDTYDVVYDKSYNKQTFTTSEPFGTQYTNGAVIDIYDDGSDDQHVYTSISSALTGFNNTDKTVYDQAVVLVGNVHQTDSPTSDNIPYTVMSIDLNHDNEPDYSYIFGHNNRQPISPIRYDFLNIMGIAEAQMPKDATTFRNVSIFNVTGWFEITNTCLVHFEQFEYDNSNYNTKSADPLILLGGSYNQFASTKIGTPTVTKYIHVGGNAWFAKFGNGTHSDGTGSTKHIPISVTGGDYDEFYLSGTYQPTVTAISNDPAECYVSGGRFGEMAGASLEQIDGNVRWQIDWADITNFFGGGINANKPITGNIRTDIMNSHVTLFCGGPKFGDMSAEKTVITNASSCTFDTYCGAGYGGTSLNRVKYWDTSGLNPKDKQGDYATDRGKYFDGATTNAPGKADYGKKGKGVATDFDYEFFYWSTGVTGGRFYVNFASFSLATTNNVTSDLNGCKITGNFYGGGYLGKVNGTATSTLDGCKVDGSVYGGGYSASLPPVYVRRTPAFTKDPAINNNIGMFEMGEINGFDTYQWKYKATADMPANGGSGMESSASGKFIYTDEDLTSLGSVGEAVLTIKGTTSVGGNAYGGGDESVVSGDVVVSIEGNAEVHGDVFGGGNSGNVSGSTTVNIQK